MARELEVTTLSEPDWEFWRQAGECRIWCAVMLSLGVDPSDKNKEVMALCAPKLFSEYGKRKKLAATHAAGKTLPSDPAHPRAGDAAPEWYVSLRDFCIYGRDKNWPELPTMVERLQLPASILTDDLNNLIPGPSEDSAAYQNLEKTLAGLLLELKRMHVENNGHISSGFFQADTQFNFKNIADGIEKAIQKQTNSPQPVSNQKTSTIRRRLSKACSHYQLGEGTKESADD